MSTTSKKHPDQLILPGLEEHARQIECEAPTESRRWVREQLTQVLDRAKKEGL